MKPRTNHVRRRIALESIGATALSRSLAGCGQSGAPNEKTDHVALQSPKNHDRLADADLPYPYYGGELQLEDVRTVFERW